MKDLQINASRCLWLVNCPASCWFPERFAFSVGLTFPLMFLLSWLKWPASSGWKYWFHVMSACNTPSLKKNKWMFCSFLNFLKKMSSERTKTNMQMCPFFLFSILFTSCSHNLLIMISMFFLQADHNHADHLRHFLTREIVWSQYRVESQAHRILGWNGTSTIIWSNKYLGGSIIFDT